MHAPVFSSNTGCGKLKLLYHYFSYVGLEIWENKYFPNDMVACGYRHHQLLKTDRRRMPKADQRDLPSIWKILHEYWVSQYQNTLQFIKRPYLDLGKPSMGELNKVQWSKLKPYIHIYKTTVKSFEESSLITPVI